MRYLWGFLVLTTMAGGEAAASFVEPEQMKGSIGPSMLVVGEAKEAGKASSPSVLAAGESMPGGPFYPANSPPSIIDLGAPSPGVAAEKVSTSTDKEEDTPALPAMVIRGGLPGDVSSTSRQAGRAEAQAAPMPAAADGKTRPTSGLPGNSRAPEPAIVDAPG
jgi:hypothetical protein